MNVTTTLILLLLITHNLIANLNKSSFLSHKHTLILVNIITIMYMCLVNAKSCQYTNAATIRMLQNAGNDLGKRSKGSKIRNMIQPRQKPRRGSQPGVRLHRSLVRRRRTTSEKICISHVFPITLQPHNTNYYEHSKRYLPHRNQHLLP